VLIDHYPTVIFDLFHTLTSLEAVKAPGPRTADILGVSRECWNTQLFENSYERLTGKIRDPYLIIERLAHAIDPSVHTETITRAVEVRTARFHYALEHPDTDTLETLQRLKNSNKKIGLISNADVMEKAGWKDSPLSQYFDSVVFSCDTGFMKPEPEIYHMCLKALDVSPSQCLYAGDGSHNELKTAKELGMITVLVIHVIKRLWPERIEGARPYARYEIDRLSELFSLTSDDDLLN
jgi:putative hydrolase of the HAD superfamily